MLSDSDLALLARDVIDELYDAVFDPAGWGRIVHLVGARVPELRPVLMIEAWSPAECQMLEFANVAPDMMASYVSDFVDDNPFRPPPNYIKARKILLTTDYISQEEFTRSRIYADLWMPHTDVRMGSANLLSHDRHAFAMLCFHYDYREQTRSLPAGMHLHHLVGPHARRAFALAIRGASLRRDARAVDLVETLAVAAMVVDASGRLIRMNSAAEAISGEGRAVALDRSGMLRAHRPVDDGRIAAAVQRATRTGQPSAVRVEWPGGEVEITTVRLAPREATDSIVDRFVSVAEPAAIVYLAPV